MSGKNHGKLGRLAPHAAETHPRLTAEDYLITSSLPNLRGVTVDWCSQVSDWPMYLNDSIGDCTFAAAGHAIQAMTAYASSEVTLPSSAILSGYEAVGGYVPGDPSTDNGANMQDVCRYWQQTGIGGHKISAFAEVKNCKDVYVLKQVLDLFGTVYVGINCPQSALDQFNAGEVWSYVPGSPIAGGHAIVLQRQYPAGHSVGVMDIITWGAVHPMTFKFAEEYIEEAWAVVSPDWMTAKGVSPEGLNLEQLQADFSALS